MPISRAFRAFALPAALALACTTVPTAYASGDDHAWEYEAAFHIQESADTYSLNMANNGGRDDEVLLRRHRHARRARRPRG